MADEFRPKRDPILPSLPENWKEMTLDQKKTWMIMYYGQSCREGEYYGLYDYASEEIKQAYEELLKEDDYHIFV